MEKEKIKCVVLMSTYNGELFIQKQIDSILSQDKVDIHLLIRDDGSKDNTVKILEDLYLYRSNVTVIKGKNIGFVKSFTKLVFIANKKFNSDFYAFVDQDDIWYPNKLLISCTTLSTNNHIPNLVTSNFDIIDGQDRYVERRYRKHPLNFTKYNFIYSAKQPGCSMVFNKLAIQLFVKYPPKSGYHDTWMFYLCFIKGATEYIDTPLFGYRIHHNNTFGISKKSKSLLDKIKSSFRNSYYDHHYKCAIELLSLTNLNMSKDFYRSLIVYITYRYKISAKIKLLFGIKYGPSVKTLSEWIRFKRLVIFNKI